VSVFLFEISHLTHGTVKAHQPHTSHRSRNTAPEGT